MSVSLLDTISSYVTPDIINKASAFLGETPASTSKAMTGIVPTLLSNVASVASAPGGLSQLESLVSKVGVGNVLNNVGSLFSGGSATADAMGLGRNLLGTILGENTGSLISAISNFSGISSASAGALLSLAAPLVLGALAKLKYLQTLTTGELARLLTGQRAGIGAAVPSALSTFAPPINAQSLAATTAAPVAQKRATSAWLPVLLGLALATALFFYLRGFGSHAAARENVKLCNGQSVSLLRDSFNYNLANFLATGSNTNLPKTFAFDHLNFNSGTTKLTPESKATVDELIVVLKACPASQVELVGHTDNTGDAESNIALSRSRASVVRDMLVSGGVAADRMTTAGYGQDRPIASNDTEEGKARNRRTELVVLRK
jgi:outer membrane protein OmpA-like peptidoglycan-associated protein